MATTQRTCIWVPLASFGFSSGTWARSLVADVEAWVRTAADATPIIFCTLPVPPEFPPHIPVEVNVASVDFFYEIATEAAEAAPSTVLRRKTPAAATIPALVVETEAEAITGDNTTGTAAGQYRLRITPTIPVRLLPDEQLQMEVTVNMGTNGVLRVYGARINIEGGGS